MASKRFWVKAMRSFNVWIWAQDTVKLLRGEAKKMEQDGIGWDRMRVHFLYSAV